MASEEPSYLEVRGEPIYLEEARQVAQEVAFQAFALAPGSTAVIYTGSGRRLFGGHPWTAPELRTLAGELVAAMRAAEPRATSADRAWFAVLPGTVRWGTVIRLHLIYIGREDLSDVEVAVGSDREHIVGLSTEGGPYYRQWDKLENLAPGDTCWITIAIDDVFDRLTFDLELRANGMGQRRLVVQVPLPTSVPAVTDRSTSLA